MFKLASPHHIPTNAYISAFVGFYFLRKLPLSIVCPLFLNMLCISPKFWFRGVFFKRFFHHFYLCLYGNPALRIQRYLPSLVPVGTYGSRYCSLFLRRNVISLDTDTISTPAFMSKLACKWRRE